MSLTLNIVFYFVPLVNASDLLLFARELSSLSNEAVPASAWAMGVNQTWPKIKSGLKAVSVDFAALSEKYGVQVRKAGNMVKICVQNVNCFHIFYKKMIEISLDIVIISFPSELQRVLSKISKESYSQLSSPGLHAEAFLLLHGPWG